MLYEKKIDEDSDIVTGDVRGDSEVPYLLILLLDYKQRTSIDLMKENGFTFKKRQKPYDTPLKLS